MQTISKLILIFLCVWIVNASAASFDCAKASSKTEKLICADAELSSLDEKLAQTYKLARENSTDKETLKRQQIEWIKGNIKNCTEVACLKSHYKRRISELEQQISEMETSGESQKWKYIASGSEHTCIANIDQIKCWGRDKYGLLNPPVKLKNIEQLVSGDLTSCAKDDAGWHCWGYCENQFCSFTKHIQRSDNLVIGNGHACSIIDGEVNCFGDNTYGQSIPPKNLVNVKKVVVNWGYSCALLDAGRIKCWGRRDNKLLDRAERLTDVRQVVASTYIVCVISSENDLTCVSGKEREEFNFFTRKKFANVFAGPYSVCGVNENMHAACVGGQGFSKEINEKNLDFDSLSIGASHMCMIKNGKVSCFGDYASENEIMYKERMPANQLMQEALKVN
ncbi:lysozyme inhibitor LprI family protein [Cellvibrio sp. pealriver]|uniref:lysozyme inhibitor LprI family protein n=1 Tax=Cellvibrio sp. pealriver TaxID=1622269 RepID=UPI000A9FA0AB|nr:lysozyme inhibitor LprI family protein [Cellvibrio sp. pealriver]